MIQKYFGLSCQYYTTTHKKLEWSVTPRRLQSDSHWNKHPHCFVVEVPLTGLHLSPLPQMMSITNLFMYGNWNFSLDVWTWNKQNVYQTLQTLSAEVRHLSFLRKSNLLTGAIIETRFQASLLAPWSYYLYCSPETLGYFVYQLNVLCYEHFSMVSVYMRRYMVSVSPKLDAFVHRSAVYR